MLKQIHTATHPGLPIARGQHRHDDAGDEHDVLLAALDAEAVEDDG